MSEYQFTIEYLKAVAKKHKDYFQNAKLGIMASVKINGSIFLTVDVINKDLPFEIRHDIEMMFWAG